MLRSSRSTKSNPTSSTTTDEDYLVKKAHNNDDHDDYESKSKDRKKGLFSWDNLGFVGGLVVMFLIVVLLWLNNGTNLPTDGPFRRSLFAFHPPDVETRCDQEPSLSRGALDKSLALGAKFMLQHQKQIGNFDYQYDWVTDSLLDDDLEVRQAGALWGLALIFHDMMDTRTDDSPPHKNLHLVASHYWNGLQFYIQNSRVLQRTDSKIGISHMRFLVYPASQEYSTGTQALVCLSIIEILRGLESLDPSVAGMTIQQVHAMQNLLSELMPFLVTQHSNVPEDSRFWAWDALVQSGKDARDTGMWYGDGGSDSIIEWWLGHVNHWRGYFHEGFTKDGSRTGQASPYYDGETLLAITKAAKYMGPNYSHLWPVASGAAEELHRIHVERPLEEDEDSNDTKGFYQWSSMCFFELATVTFGEGEGVRFDLPRALEHTYPAKAYGLWLINLALWMIDVHETLQRNKNTGYAFEGIVHAWAYAAHMSHYNKELLEKAKHFHCTIEEGMSKLTGWQVGMGLVEKNAPDGWDGERGLGGVQNSASETGLRIDTTQHQMHAVILTRRYVYPMERGAAWPWEEVRLSSDGTSEQ